MWSLTFMVDRKKRVERIPDEWVDDIRPLVEEGKEYKQIVAELFAINAQLLVEWRKQNMKKKKTRSQP